MKKWLLLAAILVLGVGAAASAGGAIGSLSFVPIPGTQVGLTLGYDGGWCVLTAGRGTFLNEWGAFAALQVPGKAFARLGVWIAFSRGSGPIPSYRGAEIYVGGGYKWGFLGIAGGVNFTTATFYPVVQVEFRVPAGG